MRWFNRSPKFQGSWLSRQVLLWPNCPLPIAAKPDWELSAFGGPQAGPVRLVAFADATMAETLRTELKPLIPEEPGGGIAQWSGAWDIALTTRLAPAMDWALPMVETYLLAEQLLILRELTRPHLPAPVVGGLPLICVDLLVRLGLRDFYMRGWWRGDPSAVTRLIAHSPEGVTCELSDSVSTFQRQDIRPMYPGDNYTGFVAKFQLNHPSLLNGNWLVELETKPARRFEAHVPLANTDTNTSLDTILPDLTMICPPDENGVAGKVRCAVETLLAQDEGIERVALVENFGPLIKQPLASVIVPLYRRIDLLEHQLAQFARDPDMARCELIYVLDSPEDADRLLFNATGLAKLYPMSFRIVIMAQSGGYAIANNHGARIAASPVLLFLNSDVLPKTPGWLPRMMEGCLNRGGAVAPKLLYEDESIQHAGEGFQPDEDGFGWNILPFFKGMHRLLPQANVAREVPLLSGACLMISRATFDDVGGFDEGFIKGDFEDADLCMKLVLAGLPLWYEPSVELYHLEGLSYPNDTRTLYTNFNRWRMTTRHGKKITQLFASYPWPVKISDDSVNEN